MTARVDHVAGRHFSIEPTAYSEATARSFAQRTGFRDAVDRATFIDHTAKLLHALDPRQPTGLDPDERHVLLTALVDSGAYLDPQDVEVIRDDNLLHQVFALDALPTGALTEVDQGLIIRALRKPEVLAFLAVVEAVTASECMPGGVTRAIDAAECRDTAWSACLREAMAGVLPPPTAFDEANEPAPASGMGA